MSKAGNIWVKYIVTTQKSQSQKKSVACTWLTECQIEINNL